MGTPRRARRDEHAKAHQRKMRLKAKLRKAGGMAGLLKTSTHALAEGGKGLIKKKSYLAETMFDALSGDERAWVGASLKLADCLEDVDIRQELKTGESPVHHHSDPR